MILSLRADEPHKGLYVNPTLPAWLPDIVLHHLRVGRCSLNLRFWRADQRSGWEMCDITLDRGVSEEESIQVMCKPAKM